MIVPRSRLLFWVGLGGLPFAALVPVTPLALVPLGILLVVIATDAARGRAVLEGIGVELPAVVRLAKDRPGTIDVRLRNDRQLSRHVRLGLAFPREIQSPQPDLEARLPAQSQFSRLTWPCTAVRRGRYILETCYLESGSPWGFWSIRGAVPARAEVRVYPNLHQERRHLAALFLHRGSVGTHALRQVGQGRDFEKLREYISGDPLNEIHWKATAKRGRPVTKVFQIEKTQEVYVVIDSSRLSARDEVLERFVTAALIVGLAAEQQGDLFGLLTFSDKVQNFVRAKNGQAHYSACRDALYTLHPKPVTPDFDSLCTFIRMRLRRRALLLVLTSLDDPMLAESFTKHIDLISRQHLVLVNMLQPAGAQPLFTAANVNQVDDIYQRLGGHIRWQNLRELERVLHHRGVGFAQLSDARLAVDLVAQYLNVKRRQQL